MEKAEIPFVATNLVEIKKVVEEFNTGVLIDSLSPNVLLEGLEKALKLKKSKSFNKDVVKMNILLNWEDESLRLLKTYHSFKNI